MLEKTVYELLSEVIQGISSNLNKKALKEVIENNPYSDYNELLKAYYDRVHRMTENNYTISFNYYTLTICNTDFAISDNCTN